MSDGRNLRRKLSPSAGQLDGDDDVDYVDELTREAMEEDHGVEEKDDVDVEMEMQDEGEQFQSQAPADTTALKNAAELFPDDTYLSQSQQSEEISPYRPPTRFDGNLDEGELPPDWDVTVDERQLWGQTVADDERSNGIDDDNDADAMSAGTDDERKMSEKMKADMYDDLDSETLPPPLTIGKEEVIPVPEPKKPLTSWIKFSLDCRAKMKEEGVKLPFKETAAYIASAFKALSPEERAKYDEEAAADKARYMEELKAYQEYRIAHLENIGGSLSHHGLETEPGELVLPLARIKRIAKLDENVKNISSEGAVAMTKATELFIQYAAIKTLRTANSKGIKRALRLDDFFDTVLRDRPLQFLKWDFKKPKKVETAPDVKAAEVQAAKSQAKQAREDAKKSKSSIFNFFGKAKDTVENKKSVNSTSNESSMEVQEEHDKAQEDHGNKGTLGDLSPTKTVVSDTARGWDSEDRLFLDP